MRIRNFADEIKKFAGGYPVGDVTIVVRAHKAGDDMYRIIVSGVAENGDYQFGDSVNFGNPKSLQDYLDNQEVKLRAEFPKSKVIVDRSL